MLPITVLVIHLHIKQNHFWFWLCFSFHEVYINDFIVLMICLFFFCQSWIQSVLSPFILFISFLFCWIYLFFVLSLGNCFFFHDHYMCIIWTCLLLKFSEVHELYLLLLKPQMNYFQVNYVQKKILVWKLKRVLSNLLLPNYTYQICIHLSRTWKL